MFVKRNSVRRGIEHAHTLARLWRHGTASAESLRRFQIRKLRVLVAHCLATSVVYRQHWRQASLDSVEIRASEDIETLPPIAKDDLRARPLTQTLTTAANPSRLYRHTTSGSSGQPFTIYRSAREEHLLNCFRLRAYHAAGLRLFDRIARLHQPPLDEVERRWPGRILQAVGIHAEEALDGLGSPADTIERLAGMGADVVCGYPSTLRHAAAWMHEHAPRRVRPRLVFSGGEVLDAQARRTIEDAFGAPVRDFYGAHEFNLLAWHCPHGDCYHVCDDNVVVEVLGDDGHPVACGDVGEVVATALHSYTMPFVRYRTGDLAVRGADACSCGAPFSTLRSIEGRTVDYLHLPGGRRVHPYVITRWIAEREADWVFQHQIVQTEADRVRLSILASRTPRKADLERLRAVGASVVGDDVRFELGVVDQLPRPARGKFHPYVICVTNATGASGVSGG